MSHMLAQKNVLIEFETMIYQEVLFVTLCGDYEPSCLLLTRTKKSLSPDKNSNRPGNFPSTAVVVYFASNSFRGLLREEAASTYLSKFSFPRLGRQRTCLHTLGVPVGRSQASLK